MIAWVEKEGKLFYMDNQTLKNPRVQEYIEIEGEPEEILGTEFIREFYDFTGGHSHQVSDFWNFKKLPKEIADKLKNGEMEDLLLFLDCEELEKIVKSAPPLWSHTAAKILLDNYPSQYFRAAVLCAHAGTTKYLDSVWQIFSERGASALDLISIAKHAPEKYQRKASAVLLEQKQWYRVIVHGIDADRAEAWELFVANHPSSKDLRYIMNYGRKEDKEKAWELFVANSPSRKDLIQVFEYGEPEHKEKAWKLFLQSNPSLLDLIAVADCRGDVYANKAQAILDSRK